MKIDPSTLLSRNGFVYKPSISYCSRKLPNLNEIWDLNKFSNFNGFISIGHVPNICDFSLNRNIRVLDCPIKFPDSEYRIPEEILPWYSTIKAIADDHYTYGYDPGGSYCYITIDQGFIEEGKSQRHSGAHVDGFQGARIQPKLQIDHSYIVANNAPTLFYNQPFHVAHLDPSKDNFFLEFDRQKNPRYIISPKPGEIVKFNAYAVHEAAKVQQSCYRTFLRMSYTVRQFDRLGNTHNPMFNYEWEMVERNIAENLK